MTDDDLRRLERAAETDGAAGVVRYAAALARVGRGDEGLARLLDVRNDPLARAALAHFPKACTNTIAGNTRFVDAPIPKRLPRVVWKRKSPGGASSVSAAFNPIAAASPLGIVMPSMGGAVLDAVTGKPRKLEVDGPLALVGELLLAIDMRWDGERYHNDLVAFDVFTGDCVHRLEINARSVATSRTRLLVLAGTMQPSLRVTERPPGYVPDGVIAYELDGRGLREIWRFLFTDENRLAWQAHMVKLAISEKLALVCGGPIFGLDPRDGRELFRFEPLAGGENPLADELGFVTQCRDGPEGLSAGANGLAAFGPGGELLWSRPLDDALAISPELVVVQGRYRHADEQHVLDRRTGMDRGWPPLGEVLLYQDGILSHDANEGLTAWALDKTPLWKVEKVRELHGTRAARFLGAFGPWIYAVSSRGHLVALVSE